MVHYLYMVRRLIARLHDLTTVRSALALCALALASFLISGCTNLDARSKAGLQIITSDVASTVFLNGQYLEKAPLIEKKLKPGEYTVRIQPDDPQYVAHETQVTLRKGLLTVITWKPSTRAETSGGVIYEMEPLKNKQSAEVSFVTIPDGAIVTMAGRDTVFSPAIITDVSPGAGEFEVTLPSYETQKHTLNVERGYRMLVTVKLAKLENSVPEAQAMPATSSATANIASGSAGLKAATATSASALKITGPSVRILPTGYLRDGKEVLRVRETPSPAGKEIGFATVGESYAYLGETQNGWYKISFAANEGWVSVDFTELVQ